MATDHEIMTDPAPSAKRVGAEKLIGTIIGREVTVSLPDHTIAFPFNRDPNKLRNFVPWYGLDQAGIFATEKDHGARIRTFTVTVLSPPAPAMCTIRNPRAHRAPTSLRPLIKARIFPSMKWWILLWVAMWW